MGISCVRCGFIFSQGFFYNNNSSGTVASLHRRHSACGWDPSLQSRLCPRWQGHAVRPIRRLIASADSTHESKGAPFVQSGGSSPQIGTPPRRVGVAPPTVGLSNEGRPANCATQLSNQEASSQGRNPSHLRRGLVIGAFCLAVWVCLAWCRLIHGSFFGLDRLSPLASSTFVLAGVRRSIPRPWCLVLH